MDGPGEIDDHKPKKPKKGAASLSATLARTRKKTLRFERNVKGIDVVILVSFPGPKVKVVAPKVPAAVRAKAESEGSGYGTHDGAFNAGGFFARLEEIWGEESDR